MGTNTQIMDVTLRDGSYAINFQFSEYETERICADLARAGFRYIEIGHGLGMNASGENGVACCTDAEYLSSALRSAGDTKIGMFCIPGIAKVEEISLLAESGISFIRVGTNIDDVEKSEPFIKEAKKYHLEVITKYMKSYAV